MGARAAATAGGGVAVAGLVISVVGLPLAAAGTRPELRHLAAVQNLSGDLLLTGITLVALGALLWVPGLALYVLDPAFSRGARQAQASGSHRVVLACTALAVVGGNLLAGLYFLPLALLGRTSASGARDSLLMGAPSPAEIAIAAVSLDVALLVVAYLRVLRPGEIPSQTLGLNRREPVKRLLVGLLLGLGLFGISTALQLLLDQAGIHQTQEAIFESVKRASPREFGLILLAGAVVAPVIEEIYFRGYVFRAYLQKKGLFPAFLFSSALFAAVHMNLPAFVPIFAMGLLLSYAYRRTGSLLPCIVAHATNNAVAFTLLYLGLP